MVLRRNEKEIAQIKAISVDHKLPCFTLIGGKSSVHRSFMSFYVTKVEDVHNEGFPTHSNRITSKARQRQLEND